MNPIDDRFRNALALQRSGDLDAAATLCRRLQEEHPEDARVLFLAGSLELQRGNAQDALPLLEAFARRHPTRLEGIHALSRAYLALGRSVDAASVWKAYARACPGDPRAWYELGVSRLATGDRDGAREALSRLVDSAGGSGRAHLSAALAWHGAGELEQARAHYEQALALDPPLHLARQNLAAVWQDLGKLDRAEALYRQVLDAEPGNADVHRNIGTLCKDRGELSQALTHYRDATLLERGPLAHRSADVAEVRRTSLHNLRLEAEQLEHLLALGRIDPGYGVELSACREIIAELDQARQPGHRRELTRAQFERVARTLHRWIHTGPTTAVAPRALNPAADFGAVARRYRESGGVAVIDDFLSPRGLADLRAYCLETTFWFDYGKAGGYSGAYMEHGFGSDLLLQIAIELREALPDLLGHHPLQQMWAYIYDSTLSGITPHADQAAVNLNFWLTPDTANRNPNTGGLVIYTREAPADWDFAAYNSRPRAIEAFVRDSASIVVPYRCNRLVLFNSNLIHQTDAFQFRQGLENRRINVTMLFGQRRNA
ncbi:hypothetical protein BH24PSE2_BH24PSE2_19790 [soil metagenome]